MALKIGTENKKQVAIAGVLGVVVLGLVIKTLVSSFSGPAPAPAHAPVTTVSVAAPANSMQRPIVVRTTTNEHEADKVPPPNPNLDPTPHFDVMEQAESLDYTGRGRNIFSVNSAPLPVIPKVTAPIRPQQIMPSNVQAGPAPPPAIDLKFFGYSAQKSGNRKAFLLHGDDVFVASEGDVVDHRYRVVKISAFTVEMEDLPYHDTQTLTLTPN